MIEDNSSNSGSDYEFDNGEFKTVNYDGILSGSNEDESYSYSSSVDIKRRNNYSKKISSILHQDPLGSRTKKTIRKNCESAKLCRQRKKMYLYVLENKAEQLRTEIKQRRHRIKMNSYAIVGRIKCLDINKGKFLEEKIAFCEKLLTIKDYLNELHDSKTDESLTNTYITRRQSNLKEYEGSDKQKSSNEAFMNLKDLEKQRRRKKGPDTVNNEMTNEQRNTRIAEKEFLMEMAINNFFYKFGVNGCLKNGVIELLKEEWLKLLHDDKPELSEQLEPILSQLGKLFAEIAKKNSHLDSLFRELQCKMKPEFVVKMLLEKEFYNPCCKQGSH